MKKNYLLSIACFILLIWSCAEEDVDYSIENKKAIEYLEKEYNIEVFSSSKMITDSTLCKIENFLIEERNAIAELNAHSQVIRDSVKHVCDKDSILVTSRAESYPLKYPVLHVDKNLTSCRISVSVYWFSSNNADVYINADHNIINAGIWKFSNINTYTEVSFKEVTFRGSAEFSYLFEGLGMKIRYQINGESNHYQGWIWMNVVQL